MTLTLIFLGSLSVELWDSLEVRRCCGNSGPAQLAP